MLNFKIISLGISVLFFCSVVGAENQSLNSLLSSIQTLQGNFLQQQFNAQGTMMQESKGRFAVSKPALLRWETQTPIYQLILSDKKDLQVYDSDLSQLTRYPSRRGIGITPAALLAGDFASLQANFRITDLNSQPRPLSCVAPKEKVSAAFCLQPKQKDDPLKAVTLTFTQQQPQTLYVRDQFKQTTVITLSNVKRNATIAKSNFSFTPPHGTEIINQNVV